MSDILPRPARLHKSSTEPEVQAWIAYLVSQNPTPTTSSPPPQSCTEIRLTGPTGERIPHVPTCTPVPCFLNGSTCQ